MKIVSAEYISSYTSVHDFKLETKPAVAFIGRSNVGKSSLINSLLHTKKLVKTSSTPGKTQMINCFLVNHSFYFIDLPGYGFAKAPIQVKNKWLGMIKEFLKFCPALKLVIQLVDIRHLPSSEDKEFQAVLQTLGISNLVVANKVDKLKKGQIKPALAAIKQVLQLTREPVIHSTPNKVGQSEIWQHVQSVID